MGSSIRRISTVYVALFRVSAAIFAGGSLLVAIVLAYDIVRDGYILVEGKRDRSFSAIGTAIGLPICGLILGLAVFAMLRRVRRRAASKGRADK